MHQLISRPVNGQYNPRAIGIAFDLLAKTYDKIINGAGGDLGLVAPYFFEQLMARYHVIFVFIQIGEDFKFLMGEFYLLPVLFALERGEIDHQPANSDWLILLAVIQ